MNKNGKNENTNEKQEKKYSNYPFNLILNMYIDSRINSKRKNDIKYTGVRASYKQDIYDELESETGIPCETIKNYSIGKSTLPKSNFSAYKKFAKLFKCSITDILPETKDEKNKRIALLEKMGLNEEIYNRLRRKKAKTLFGPPLEATYLEILRSIIIDTDFLDEYEKIIDTDFKDILDRKKNIEALNSMSYIAFNEYLIEKGITDLEKMKSSINAEFNKSLTVFIKKIFDKNRPTTEK